MFCTNLIQITIATHYISTAKCTDDDYFDAHKYHEFNLTDTDSEPLSDSENSDQHNTNYLMTASTKRISNTEYFRSLCTPIHNPSINSNGSHFDTYTDSEPLTYSENPSFDGSFLFGNYPIEWEWDGNATIMHMYFMRHFHSAWNAKKAAGKESGNLIPAINWKQDVGISVVGARQFSCLAESGVNYVLQDIQKDLHESGIIAANLSSSEHNRQLCKFIGNNLQIHSSNLKRTMYGGALVKALIDLKLNEYELSCMYTIISNLQETTAGSDAKSEFKAFYLKDLVKFAEYLLHGMPSDYGHSADLEKIIKIFMERIAVSPNAFAFIDKNITGIGSTLKLYRLVRSFGIISEQNYVDVEQTHKRHVDPVGYAKILNKLKDGGILRLITVGHSHWFQDFIAKYGIKSTREWAGKMGRKLTNAQIVKVRIVFPNKAGFDDMVVDQIREFWSC